MPDSPRTQISAVAIALSHTIVPLRVCYRGCKIHSSTLTWLLNLILDEIVNGVQTNRAHSNPGANKGFKSRALLHPFLFVCIRFQIRGSHFSPKYELDLFMVILDLNC